MKNLETVLREGNNTTNQRIKERFISQHVNANVNSLVEYVLSKSYEDTNAPFCFDDIENMFSYPELRGVNVDFEGGTEEDKQEELKSLNAIKYNIEEDEEDTTEIKTEIEELENLESEPQDVLEWWLVSSFLMEKLKELGYPVIEDKNIWGRCTSGQAILLDYSITQICAEMEILEGQKCSWA